MKHIAFLLAGLMTSYSYADTATTSLNASARISPSCVISAGNMEFGDITPRSTSTEYGTATSSINVKCTNKTSYSIYQGWGANGSETARLLKGTSSGATIRYFICTAPGIGNDNCANDKKWWPYGFTGPHNYRLDATGDGTTITHTVYGGILKRFVNADNYSDTVITEVVF